MKVDRVYTREVVATRRAASLVEAAETMRRFHVGTLVVIDEADGRRDVAGIVTDRDLVVHGLAGGLDAKRARVEQVMAPVVASVPEGAELLEALERMRAAGVRRLLVTKSNGDPAGIVSLDDAVDGLLAELSSVAALIKSERHREAADTAASL